MRRPAPLPAPAEEPVDDETVAPRPWRRGRVGAPSADGGERAVRIESDATDQDVDALSDTAVIVDAASEDGSTDAGTSSRPLRSSDVWRAARARRRALRAEIRRFTQRSRRRRVIWSSSIGAVVVLVLGSILAAYSPLFAIERIAITGARTVDAAAVQKALASEIGSPLALIDDSAVKSALTQFPMIESYSLEARPPHELLVRIVERTPVGVIRSDGGYTLVDAAGVVLATTPDRPEGQPLLNITGGTDTAAFRSAGLVIRSLPADLRAQVTQVDASTLDDVALTLQDGKDVLWGSEEDSVTKALVLVALIKKAPNARAFDVSAPTVPVIR